MPEFVGYLLGVLFVATAVLVLVAMFRFGVVSALILRGARQRLRMPDVAGVERICGFGLPPALADHYRHSDLVEHTEVTLVDDAVSPPARWFVGAFKPLCAVDVQEWCTISGVSGVPIADDSDKGMYYIARDGTVRLDSPDVPGRDALVARTVSDFFQFRVVRGDADEYEGV